MAILLLAIVVRAALVGAGTACVLWALRIRAAALRHAAWTTVVVAMLLLPIWSVAGPNIRLAVLPPTAAWLDSGSAANAERLDAGVPASGTRPEAPPSAQDARTVSGISPGMVAVAGVYLLGAFVLLARLVIGTVQARRFRRAAVVRAGRATSARCATPITVGWFSPVLILPEGWEQWSAARLDAVVTHEGEHARRHDPLVQWLALLNRAIFWFHPLAWWLERQLANLAEEVCDAAVIRAGHSPQEYSSYLLDMARALRREGGRLNVVGMAMPGSNLAGRMRRIFEEFPMTALTRTRVVVTLALCAISSAVFAAGVLAPRPSAAVGSPAVAGGQVNASVAPAEPPPSQAAAAAIREGQRKGVVSSAPVDQAGTSAGPRSPNSVAAPRAESPKVVPSEPPQVAATDFSGHWRLVSSTTSGPGRGGSGGEGATAGTGERKVTAIWSSGAPVNCGPACTISQNAETLTISRLGTPDAVTRYDNGVVVLNLNGSDSKVFQESGSHYVVHAKWNGRNLVVTYDFAYYTITQVLSVEDGKLKVVTSFGSYAPVTMTYVKG